MSPKRQSTSEKESVSIEKAVADQFRSYVDQQNIEARIRGFNKVTYSRAMSAALLAAIPDGSPPAQPGDSDADNVTPSNAADNATPDNVVRDNMKYIRLIE
jgi:hypothetical protein